MRMTHEAFLFCQQIVADHEATVNEHDAASEAITAYRCGKPIDMDIGSMLAGYANRQRQQNRWGK